MPRRRTYAVDWDGTLVDVKTKQWLPGATLALKQMLQLGDVIIWSCRASWPEGLAEIIAKLSDERLYPHRHLHIVAKPNADVYVDDKALRFTGDWPATVIAIRSR